MVRIDNNSLLLLIFFIFFVLLPSDNNSNSSKPNTLYEKVQLQELHNIYTNELKQLNDTSYKEPLKNVTGFMYTLNDLKINEKDYNESITNTNNETSDIWYGYPLPNKKYDYKYDLYKQENNYLPQKVLDTVFKQTDKNFKGIWSDLKENVSDKNITFVKNITSTTLRGFFNQYDSFDNEFIHMPIPNYYKIQQNESSPIPQFGSFFINDTLIRSLNNSVHLDLSSNDKLKIDITDHIYYPTLNDETRENSLSFYSATISVASSHLIPTVSDLLLCYDHNNGRLFGITNSAKFHGLFAIPSLISADKEHYDTYKQNVMSLVQDQYLKDNFTLDNIFIMGERAQNPEFIFYAQVAPLEDDLNEPKDSDFTSLYDQPRFLEIESLMLYSVDTARSYYNLKPSFNGILGSFMPLKIKYDSMLYITLPFVIFMVGFFWQIQKLNSPSELNKISNWTLKTLSYSDSLTGVVFLIMGITLSGHTNGQFSWFVVNAALFLIMGMFFELRVSVLILHSQFLERSFSIQTLFQRFNTSNNNTENSDENNENGEETNTTNAAAAPVANTTGGEDAAFILPRLQGQLFFQLFMSTFIVVILYSSAPILRHLVVNIIQFIQTSMFWAQIFRFVLIDYTAGTSSLSSYYVVIVAITRLIPVVYFFNNEDNFFQHSTDRLFLLIFVSNMCLQVILLLAQLRYGGRSILPNFIVERLEATMGDGSEDGKKRYDYHRAITEEELEHMGNKNEFVCPICMDEDNKIHLEIKSSGVDDDEDNANNDTTSNILRDEDEKKYMITPCNHIYHPECLTYWMNNKLVCPVCRNNLPPL